MSFRRKLDAVIVAAAIALGGLTAGCSSTHAAVRSCSSLFADGVTTTAALLETRCNPRNGDYSTVVYTSKGDLRSNGYGWGCIGSPWHAGTPDLTATCP